MVRIVKKKMLECPVHGQTLFRCKRKCWKGTPGKPHVSEYTEKCFKCIAEGRYPKKVKPPRKKRSISLRS